MGVSVSGGRRSGRDEFGGVGAVRACGQKGVDGACRDAECVLDGVSLACGCPTGGIAAEVRAATGRTSRRVEAQGTVRTADDANQLPLRPRGAARDAAPGRQPARREGPVPARSRAYDDTSSGLTLRVRFGLAGASGEAAEAGSTAVGASVPAATG